MTAPRLPAVPARRQPRSALARHALYGATGAGLALPMLALLVLVVAGAVGSLVVVGLPVLAASLLLVRLVGAGERRLLSVCGLRTVDAPAYETPSGWAAVRSLVTAPSTGRVLGWVVLRTATGTTAAAALLLGLWAAFALVAASVVDGWFAWGSWVSSAGWSAVGFLPLAVLALLAGAGIVAATGWTQAQAAALLGPSPAEASEAERAAASDRARRTQLARDLHDSLGHNITVALLQMGAAERLLATDVEAARHALQVSERESRAALRGLDRVMAVLQGRAAEVDAAHPARDVVELVRTLSEAGLSVSLTADDLEPLPSEVSAAAYRVVQEAGTNILRHAPDATTRIAISRHDPWVRVRIVNDPPEQRDLVGRLGPGSGQGLAGLTIVCEQLGGGLTAGPTPAGGWQVDATLRSPVTA